jgi:general secretion pathway protein A
VAVLQARLACLRSAAGGLPLVRQLARPGLLTLRGPQGQVAYALLTGLGPTQARLQVGGQGHLLTLSALAGVWRGEYATYWRTPPAWQPDAAAHPAPALLGWIRQQLDAAGPPDPSVPLSERIRAFQVAHGLPADGVIGPLTGAALTRSSPDGDADEPRLAVLP